LAPVGGTVRFTITKPGRGPYCRRGGIGYAKELLPPSRRLLDIVAGNLQLLAPGPRSVLDTVAVAERLPLAMLAPPVR